MRHTRFDEKLDDMEAYIVGPVLPRRLQLSQSDAFLSMTYSI